MVKKLLALLVTSLLVFFAVAPVYSQDAAAKPAKEKKAEQARWEGIVVRSSAEKMTLDVRKRGGNVEKSIHYDASTKWTSQEHGSKTVNNITASDVKDGDRVICLGKYDEKGEFQASLVSKRLTK
jgi:hypothetical protein